MSKHTESQASGTPKAASRRLWLGRLILFCGISVYLELCLHAFLFRSIDRHIVYPTLFGLMTGVVTALLSSLLPKTLQRIAALLLVGLQCLMAEVQLIYHAVFGNLMPVSQLSMGGGVITEFLDQTLYAIRQNLLPVILLLLPLAALLVLRLRKGLKARIGWKQALMAPVLLCALIGVTAALMHLACGHPVPIWRIFRDAGTSTDMSYRNLGMTATTLQELRYLVFGQQRQEGEALWQETQNGEESYSPDEWNVMRGLDFSALEASTDDSALAALDRYCAGKEPTAKNAYTGCLKGYNVIVFCAESFSPLLIDPERTPTLYKMSQSGFVFENYYGCFNSMTTNGEYTTCLGLFPDMTRAKYQSSFDASVGHYLPFSLGMILKDYGYSTWAYHNNNAEFYNRSQTHPNMGYYFQAQGSGLDVTPHRPASDLEMMEQSVDDYLYSDQPFHAYYMTYSGHYHYTWGNDMSEKHQAEVMDLPYPSEEVKAYIACNMEVEYALAYLEQRLEEAGKLDSTLIVLTNDHYPYGLTEDQYNELAGRKIDVNFEKYRNSFICWCPGLGETVPVETYCSTVDILPTVLNLLGVEYDSRLLAGSDALSEGRHAAILGDGSFLTDGFRYNETTGELFTDPGVEVDAEKLQSYRAWVADKFTFSREVLNTDYYAHVFPDGQRPENGGMEIPFDDQMPVRTQGNILFIYRKGLMDLYAERTFGPEENATLGDYVTAVYRYYGEPEVTEDALPEGYQADRLEDFRQDVQYRAVCWAFAEGLIRADDRITDYRQDLDNVALALMLYRSYERLGAEDMTVDRSVLEGEDIHNDVMTEAERDAVAWCLEHHLINGNGSQTNLFDDKPENKVIRYRIVLLLMLLYYPEITR